MEYLHISDKYFRESIFTRLEVGLVDTLGRDLVILHVTAVLRRKKSLRPSVTRVTMQL